MRQDFLDRLIDLALEEDLGAAGDVTSEATVDASATGRAELWAKERLVLSGLGAFSRVFERVDPAVKVRLEKADGEAVGPKTLVATLQGRLRSLLVAERTALNIVQRTCGIATFTRSAVDAVAGSSLTILDTRKTAPGMRALSKAAVRDGGAKSHRFGLFDGVLIKDNHIAAAGGSVRQALRKAKERTPHLLRIEIEVATLEQLSEALAEGAEVIMLDNMSDEQIREAVRTVKGRAKLEVSGGVTLERLPKLAKLGVDFVSVGALTHSARAVDLSLEVLSSGRARRG